MQFTIDAMSLVLGALVGAAGSSALFFYRLRTQMQIAAHLESQLAETTARHQDEVARLRDELSIVAYPYEEEIGNDGWVLDDRKAEVGYQFQLFLRGIPCFEPHRIVVKKFEKKEVSREKIKQAAGDVLQLLDTWATKHPAIAVADKFRKLIPN